MECHLVVHATVADEWGTLVIDSINPGEIDLLLLRLQVCDWSRQRYAHQWISFVLNLMDEFRPLAIHAIVSIAVTKASHRFHRGTSFRHQRVQTDLFCLGRHR